MIVALYLVRSEADDDASPRKTQRQNSLFQSIRHELCSQACFKFSSVIRVNVSKLVDSKLKPSARHGHLPGRYPVRRKITSLHEQRPHGRP